MALPSVNGTVLATTRGNIDVPGTKGVKLGLNLYAYSDYKVEAAA